MIDPSGISYEQLMYIGRTKIEKCIYFYGMGGVFLLRVFPSIIVWSWQINSVVALIVMPLYSKS